MLNKIDRTKIAHASCFVKQPRCFGFAEQNIIEDQIEMRLKERTIRNSCFDYIAPINL